MASRLDHDIAPGTPKTSDRRNAHYSVVRSRPTREIQKVRAFRWSGLAISVATGAPKM